MDNYSNPTTYTRGLTVSEEIGDEYKHWGSEDVIMISSPTGSGKSYFVLHTLLEWAISNGRTILYLVNRKILKAQLQEEVYHTIQPSLDQRVPRLVANQNIRIMTYQEIEYELKFGQGDALGRYLRGYYYIVYDECHYFLSDSIFNPATSLSFDFLARQFNQKVQIFMSATIKDMAKYIEDKRKEIVAPRSIADIKGNAYKQQVAFRGRGIKEYTIETNYKYIQLFGISDEDDIYDLVKKSDHKKEKWLIFVDSILKGEDLCKDLKETIDKEDVVFIDAEYENNEDTRKSVQEIARDKILPKKVAICTAVLDNGVSLHDFGLRNIVVLADMEEEFIQMLGRKRIDNETINLYICKRNKEFFARRLNRTKKTRDCIKKYEGTVIKTTMPIRAPQDSQTVMEARQALYEAILQSEYVYKNLKRACYMWCGNLYLSDFSINRLAAMEEFYRTMITEFENNDDAFLRKQAEWLGMTYEEIDMFCSRVKNEMERTHLSSLEEKLAGYLSEAGTGEQADGIAKKELLKTLKKDLIPLLNADNQNVDGPRWTKIITHLNKGELSINDFNMLMKQEFICLPYRLESLKGGGMVRIIKIEETGLDEALENQEQP